MHCDSLLSTLSSHQSALRKIILVTGISLSVIACGGKTADEHIEAAKAFAQEGNNQAAIVELKNAVQQAPRLATARFELGKLYIENKNYESAEKELSRALELGYPPEQVIPLLSQAYQRTGASAALAELDIDNANLPAAERLEVGYRKLQSLLQLNKEGEANALLNELLNIESVSVYKGLVRAVSHVLDQDVKSALEQAKALREQAPLNRDVLNFTARMYMINQQMTEAVSVYEDYIRVAPEDIEVKFALTNMLVEQGQMEKAEVYIDELMQINDQNGLLNQLKALTRAAANDHQAALNYSETAIQNGRNEPAVRLVAGYSAYQLGEFEKAVGHLSYVAEFLPDNHPGLRILVASQLQANMGDETNEVLARLDDVTAADATLFSRAGYELLKAGDENAAKEVIAQAEKISETADDLTRLGILKLSVNDVEGMLNLEQAVEKAPESVTAKTTLASAYLATEQLEKALELAKEWQRQAPASVDGYLLQAEVEQRREQYAEAESTLEKAQSLDVKEESVLSSKVRLMLRQTKFDQAKDAAEKLLEVAPQNIVALAALFAIDAQDGDASQSQQRIESALNNAPDNLNIRLLAARASLSSNNAQKTLDLLSAIDSDRNAPAQYWPLKGGALIRLNQVNEAEKHYQTWVEFYPNQENAVLGLLLVLDGKRDYQQALRVTDDYLSREDNLQVGFIRAYLLTMTNNLPLAKQAMSSIDDEYKALPFLRGVEARIALLENRPKQAVDDALSAYEANPSLDNLILVIRAYDGSAQLEKSYEIIASHAERFSNDIRVLMLLGERQLARDEDAAIETYERVLELSPDNFVVLNNLAYVLGERGDLQRAETLSSRAYEIQPDNVATADTYAQVLVKRGRIDDALEVYKRVINDRVENEEVLLNYVETLLRNGDTVLAKRRLDRISVSQPGSAQRVEQLKQTYDL